MQLKTALVSLTLGLVAAASTPSIAGPAEGHPNIIVARTATDRAASLTHRLLAFSRRQILDPKITRVNDLVGGFHVDGFGSAFWGSILISIVSWTLSAFFRGSDGRVHPLTHHPQMRRVEGRVVGSSKPGES